MDEQRRRRIEELLPWYVNGSLDERETDEVSEAIERSDELKAMLEREITVSQRFRNTPSEYASVMRREGRAYDALLERIGPEHPSPARGQAPGARSARFQRRVSLAAAGAAVIVLMATMGVWMRDVGPERPYRTLTSPAAVNGEVKHVEVVVSSDAGAAAVAAMLRDTQGTLVRSPVGDDVYRIVVPVSPESTRWLERLQHEPGIARVSVE
jgi:anti-sigma-K factor RskA